MSEYKKLLFTVRNQLKSGLVRSPGRLVWSVEGYKPLCPVCGTPILYMAPDMHEVFITRGDIQRHNIDPELVFVRYNCVLLHPGTCHIKAATSNGQELCQIHLIKVEGAMPILEWLEEVETYFKSTTITEAKNKIRNLVQEHNYV